MSRLCTGCGLTLAVDQFYRQGDRLRSRCIACYAAHNREQRVEHAEKRAAYDVARGNGWERSGRARWASTEMEKWAGYVRRAYGITAERVMAMLAGQGGVCAICAKHCNRSSTARLSIDHDHGTGEVRGLLCFKCNVGLGRFNDNPALLDAAAVYLRKHAPLGRQVLYLSGPMSGLPDLNYPAFHAEARRLRAMGHLVENPAESTAPSGTTWADYMRLAIRQLLRCQSVALLPGWEGSRGAQLEVHVARAIGMPVVSASELHEARAALAIREAE